MSPLSVLSYCRKNFGTDEPIDRYIEIPCGRCLSCDKRRLRDFRIRLQYEMYVSSKTLFFTMTFDDPNLARFEEDPNKAVRLFLDRARKYLGRQIRHFVVAEYGKLHGRLHYHAMLFNVSESLDADILAGLWSYGRCDCQVADENAPKYLCKYVTKLSNIVDGKRKRPPRIVSSKGIGMAYLSRDNIRFHVDGDVLRPFLYFGSVKVPLPRYYAAKLFSDDQKIQMLLDREYNPQTEWYWQGRRYTNYYEFIKARRATFEQRVNLGLSEKKKK